MTPSEIKAHLETLREWRQEYYNGTPVVIDAVYDALEDDVKDAVSKLPATDPLRVEADAFFGQVGATIPSTGAWVKVKHTTRMGSLNKAQEQGDMGKWVRVCGAPPCKIIVSEKCDGISVGLTYLVGQLTLAATRGDGEEGEDITRNVLQMKGIVPVIKGFTGFIRGEIVLKKSDWKKHFPTYSNPRNAASGIAKRLDGVGAEHLTVLHYQIIRDTSQGEKPIPNKGTELKILGAVGAACPNWFEVSTLDEVEAIYKDYVATKRDSLDYDIDGMVVEFNDPSVMSALGMLNNRPKGAIAWKFPHDQKPTILRNIRWQVGNTGRITPVAEFDTVRLAGADVSQASLHNVTRVQKLKLFIGCRIVVSRRNDVIPMVESNIDEGVSVDDFDS